VSNVVDFGAFVVLADGIEGLLHITEMGDGTLTEPYSYVKRGDVIPLQIVRIEKDRKRIGFTQKELNLAGPANLSELADVEEPGFEEAGAQVALDEDLAEESEEIDLIDISQELAASAQSADQANPELADRADEAETGQPKID
jgi:transcriptional accessory protein Tex/SPT6